MGQPEKSSGEPVASQKRRSKRTVGKRLSYQESIEKAVCLLAILKLLTKITLQYLQESFCKNSVLLGTFHNLSTQG